MCSWSYSAGIAMRNSPDDTLAAMLKRADATLYNAKAQGRSRTLDARCLRLQASLKTRGYLGREAAAAGGSKPIDPRGAPAHNLRSRSRSLP